MEILGHYNSNVLNIFSEEAQHLLGILYNDFLIDIVNKGTNFFFFPVCWKPCLTIQMNPDLQ